MINIVSTDIFVLLKRFSNNVESYFFYVRLKESCTGSNYATAMNRENEYSETKKRGVVVVEKREEKRERAELLKWFEIYTVIEWKFLTVYIVCDVIGKSPEKDKIPL